jgi:hypothetical protein
MVSPKSFPNGDGKSGKAAFHVRASTAAAELGEAVLIKVCASERDALSPKVTGGEGMAEGQPLDLPSNIQLG